MRLSNPESQAERTNAEQKAFYAKQNEIRAQNQAERQRSAEEHNKADMVRIDAEDAKRKTAYAARLAQAEVDAAAKHEAAEHEYEAKRVQAQVVQQSRYAARKEAQDKKEAEEEAASVAEIAQCKANPKCTWERVSKPLCEAIQTRRGHVQDMAREKSNPSGFVNARYLRDLGSEIQTCDENIAMFRKDYREQMGRSFNENTCP